LSTTHTNGTIFKDFRPRSFSQCREDYGLNRNLRITYNMCEAKNDCHTSNVGQKIGYSCPGGLVAECWISNLKVVGCNPPRSIIILHLFLHLSKPFPPPKCTQNYHKIKVTPESFGFLSIHSISSVYLITQAQARSLEPLASMPALGV